MSDFYDKTTFDKYDQEHGPRMDFAIEKCGLDKITGKVIDLGAGSCYILKKMIHAKDKTAVDSSEAYKYKLTPEIDKEIYRYRYSVDSIDLMGDGNKRFYDAGICFETFEHVASPYQLLLNLKWMIKEGGDIFLSIPDVSVTHNTPYPGLFYPETNFVEFIEQCAVIPIAHFIWDKDWKTHIYHCKNLPWTAAKIKFPKPDAKFVGATPIDYANS